MKGSVVELELVPVLSRGKHRTPAKGACFMEFASYLAGERWSDHPDCTHPGLAFLARMVNDCTSDASRGKLAALIPSVIGLTTDDPRLDVIVALRAVSASLPVAAEPRQRALAAGAIAMLDYLERKGGSGPVDIRADVDAALASVPYAERWAREFLALNNSLRRRTLQPRHSRELTLSAVDGLVRACQNDIDDRLRALLTAAIDDCARFIGSEDARAAVTNAAAKEAPAYASRARRVAQLH